MLQIRGLHLHNYRNAYYTVSRRGVLHVADVNYDHSRRRRCRRRCSNLFADFDIGARTVVAFASAPRELWPTFGASSSPALPCPA